MTTPSPEGSASGLSDMASGGRHFWLFSPQMQRDGRSDGCHRCAVTDLQKFQRVCRVFLARLLMVHGEDAPKVLRRIADELEWLEAERAAELASGDRDPAN